MAQYGVTHSCGHTEDVALFGPHRERERKMDWMRSRPCTDCAADSHMTANQQAAAANSAEGLPSLAGTDKQISWAESIRREKMAELTAVVTSIHTAASNPDVNTMDVARLLEAANAVRAQSSAAWWIDHRRDDAQHLMRLAAQGAL